MRLTLYVKCVVLGGRGGGGGRSSWVVNSIGLVTRGAKRIGEGGGGSGPDEIGD